MKRDNHNRISIARFRLADYHQGGAGLNATSGYILHAYVLIGMSFLFL
jgi:hypothetical protein